MVHSLSYTVLNKEVGQTPLEAIQQWRREHPAYQDVPASYAGRLDPMASGKLLVLLGDECKKQDTYTGLDKEYEVEVLLGVMSDTGDVLGVVEKAPQASLSPADIDSALAQEKGTHEREYPVFSSKTVKGKPLFLYALEGTLGQIQIPTHPEAIYSISLLDSYSLSSEELKERVEGMLAKAPVSDEPSKQLGADFRIKEVREAWGLIFSKTDTTYRILKIRVVCGTGSYMRSLAGRIGISLGTGALALSIHRTKIGRYLDLPMGLGFFVKLFS